MLSNFTLLLATPPAAAQAASVYGLPLAHLAYRIGGGHLLRANLPIAVRGGLMVVDSTGFDGVGDPSAFAQEVLRECACRGYDGVLCSFDGTVAPLLGQIVEVLSRQLGKRGFPLYVEEPYARFSSATRVMLSSALSGGSLKLRLQEGAATYGAERLVLALELLREDFYLPSPSGSGRPLTAEALSLCLRQRAPSVFFDSDLCSRYFTYMTQKDGAHFVLFDDGGTLREKMSVAA
ncbi:MAG: hypothetical protein RSB55_07200, partial [Oscillospiraceae bacterium]